MSNLRAERIEIIPLSAEQLRLWVNDIQSLEKQLDCHYEGEPVMGSLLISSKDKQLQLRTIPKITNITHYGLSFVNPIGL